MSRTRLTLLVAGESPASLSARANLAALVGDGENQGDDERRDSGPQIVDVLVHPEYALRYRAFFMPTLIVESEIGTTTIVGDLRDLERVKLVLRAAAA